MYASDSFVDDLGDQLDRLLNDNEHDHPPTPRDRARSVVMQRNPCKPRQAVSS